MKRILFVGLFALMVLLVAPAMAATTAPVTLAGPVTASYSIAATPGAMTAIPGPWLQFGQNDFNYGSLDTTVLNTAWSVTATTNGLPADPSKMVAAGPLYLTNSLQQLDAAAVPAMINVAGYTDGGALGDTGHSKPLYYRQNVVAGDQASATPYSLTITYTISAP